MNLDLIVKNKEFILLTISFFGVVLPFAGLILTKRKEQKQINFENFHKNLMKDLVNLKGDTGLDQQVAIIYELRNYPEYYPVIRRVLGAGVKSWSEKSKSNPNLTRLIGEARRTIEFTNKNRVQRFLKCHFNND